MKADADGRKDECGKGVCRRRGENTGKGACHGDCVKVVKALGKQMHDKGEPISTAGVLLTLLNSSLR